MKFDRRCIQFSQIKIDFMWLRKKLLSKKNGNVSKQWPLSWQNYIHPGRAIKHPYHRGHWCDNGPCLVMAFTNLNCSKLGKKVKSTKVKVVFIHVSLIWNMVGIWMSLWHSGQCVSWKCSRSGFKSSCGYPH